MTRRTRRWAGALLAATLLLAACADDEPDQIGAGTDEPEEPEPDEPEEPEEPTDPFAIPDEIDEEYTQRVLDELMPRLRAADREELDDAPSSMPSDETVALYRAYLDVSVSSDLLAYLATRLSTEQGVEEFRAQVDELGDVHWVVQEVGDADEACIPFEFTYEYTATEDTNIGVGALVPLRETRDPDDLNPTPWAVGLSGHPDVVEESLDTICEATQQAQEDFEQEREQDAANPDQEPEDVEGEA